MARRNLRGVPEFLSDDWIAALANACRDSLPVREPADDPRGAARLVVDPVVRGVPGRGEVRYRMTFSPRACSVASVAVDAAPADVCLETDYETAVALARGDMNAQVSLAAGRLRVSGDVARLAAHASALAQLQDLFEAVRATTTYPGRRIRDDVSGTTGPRDGRS